MVRILLPVDGSEASDRAVEHFVQNVGAYGGTPEVHLLNVQAPLRGDVTTFVGGAEVRDFHRERGDAALASARERLQALGLPFEAHIVVGDPATVIARFARERAMDQIVMGARAGRFADLLRGSVVSRTLDLAPVPVLVVK